MRSKTIRTSKVKRELQATITPDMQAIIDRWGNKDRQSNSYIFDYLKGNETPLREKAVINDIIRRCNRQMKHIGEQLVTNLSSTFSVVRQNIQLFNA